MNSRPGGRVRRAAALGICLIGCARESPRGAWEGRVDTLPSGVLVVSNPSRGLWDSASAWTVVEDLRIGSADGEPGTTFGQVRAIEVDARGRIYVLDAQAQDVRRFDPDGRWVRTIGRQGGGPGEFQRAVGLVLDPAGRLWVLDIGSRRYSVFDTAGRFETSYARGAVVQSIIATWGFVADGGLWDSWPLFHPGQAASAPTAFWRFDTTSGYSDSLVLPPFEQPSYVSTVRRGTSTMRYSFPVPFGPEELTALDRRGFVWRAISDEYRVTQISLQGDSVRVVSRVYQRQPVTGEDRERALRPLRDLDLNVDIDPSRIPDLRPALTGMLADDRGYLWVAPIGEGGGGGLTLDVFDPDGRYLGEVATPMPTWSTSPRPLVRGPYLYYVTVDSLDVPYVVRARIEGK